MRLDVPLNQPHGVLGASYRRPHSPVAIVLRVLVVAALLASAVLGVTAAIPQGPAGAAPVAVSITDGTSASPVLTAAHLLRYPRTFAVVRAFARRSIQPGAYTLSPHLSVWSLVRVLTTTRPRPERTLTIIEGWNLRDIGQYLEREGVARAAAFHAIAGYPAVDYRFAPASMPHPKDFRSDFPVLADKPDAVGIEGYLFPDTYRVYADASVEDIVRRMLVNFDRKLTPELRQQITASGRTLHQMLTVASLVEAEVQRPDDRAIVAGILWKRRDRGMLLQVDATVNYVTGKHDPSVTGEDTAVDSSYNTYKYPGLPRGPIGNPGLGSIIATIQSQPSPYWFFLTTKDGHAVYARTFEEHQANIQQYLK